MTYPAGTIQEDADMNTNDRAPDELRMVRILPDYTEMAAGSVLICCG